MIIFTTSDFLKAITHLIEKPELLKTITPKTRFEKEWLITFGIQINKERFNLIKKNAQLHELSNEQEIIIDCYLLFRYLLKQSFTDINWNEITTSEILLKTNNSEWFITIKNKLNKEAELINHEIFKQSLLESNYNRSLIYSVEALYQLKKGIGVDNLYLVFFNIHHSLELYLKNVLINYYLWKQKDVLPDFNFHNLSRLLKLISLKDQHELQIQNDINKLKSLFSFFQKINPSGQWSRYHLYYDIRRDDELFQMTFNEIHVINNFTMSLSLLQIINSMFLKKINEQEKTEKVIFNYLRYASSFNNINQSLFENYEELIHISLREIAMLKVFIRIGGLSYLLSKL